MDSGDDDETMDVPSALDGPRIPAGHAIGRYVVEHELGRGGMGVVYAARDPELDRAVAIKLVRPGARRDVGAATDALLDEARVLAQLNDPNVVQIFDVGRHEADVYLAMELVAGETLAAWLSSSPRSLPEVLAAFTAAGRGLSAAHRQGIVHRDFKPANVLVGTDGRVRVVDFGLATADASGTSTSGSSGGRNVRGTLGYMPPEQQRGDVTDARSDQYSFCVALHVGVTGGPPVIGESGGVTAVPTATLSPQLAAVIARGLSADPEARWPTMESLLAALEPPRRRKRWLVPAVAASVIGVAIVATRGSNTSVCRDPEAMLAEVWTRTTADELRTHFGASSLEYADDTADRVTRRIDTWAADWTTRFREACDTDAPDPARVDCLVERHDELRAAVAVLRGGDDSTLERAIGVVNNLGVPSACTEPTQDTLVPPVGAASEVERIRGSYRDARAQAKAGRITDARTTLDAVQHDAEALGWDPLRAEVMVLVAELHAEEGHADVAAGELEQAFLFAQSCGHDKWARHAATLLVHLFGNTLHEDTEAQRWAREALALTERTASTPTERAQLLHSIGAMHEHASRFPEARAAFAEGLALREGTLEPDHPNLAASHNSMGIVDMRSGSLDDALEHATLAVDIGRSAYGDHHPQLALYLANKGSVLLTRREHRAGREAMEEATAIREATLGVDHPMLAYSVHTLGIAFDMEGDSMRALVYFDRALQMRKRRLDPEHPDIADSHNSIGVAQASLGFPGAARESFARSLVLYERRVGPDSHLLIQVHGNLGKLGEQALDFEQARIHYVRAAEIVEVLHGADSTRLARPLIDVARVYAAAGRKDEARKVAERAHALATVAGDAEAIATAASLRAG